MRTDWRIVLGTLILGKDRVRRLYVWSDRKEGRVQGVLRLIMRLGTVGDRFWHARRHTFLETVVGIVGRF